MPWVITASAVLFIAAIVVARRLRRAQRVPEPASWQDVTPVPDFDASESMRPEKRVQQFRMTGSSVTAPTFEIAWSAQVQPSPNSSVAIPSEYLEVRAVRA